MASVDLIVFDDAAARDWYPFTLTRPAGELMLGTMKLRERIEHVCGARCTAYITSQALTGFHEFESPPVIDVAQIDSTRARLYFSSRCVPQWNAAPDLTSEATFRVAGQVAGWLVPAGAPGPTDAELRAPSGTRGTAYDLDGTVVENVWDLVGDNADHVRADILHLHPDASNTALSAGVHVIGEFPLVLGADVTIEPGVVFDLSDGPVWLDDGATVMSLSRVAGPLYVGRGSALLGGVYNAGTIGPRCKIHGEFEESIVLGYSNKAHDGFIGHALIGMWVNFGALTTNSDLKNNYSNVRVHTPRGEVDSGLMKLGSLIGDHVKTAIGTMLNTGTVIGPGANVFGGMPAKHVPPFAWGEGKYELDKFLNTADIAMGRREVTVSPSQREMLTRVYGESE